MHHLFLPSQWKFLPSLKLIVYNDHLLPSYSVIAADTLHDLVTLTFWFMLVVIHGGSRDQPLHQVWRSYGCPFFSYEFWLLTGYRTLTMHLQPLRMHRITWPVCRGKFFAHIWNPWPRFAYSLYNFFRATIKINGVICPNSVWPMLKTTQLSAHAQNHASPERCRKPFTMIFLGDHDIP